ncbi:MAG: hypothetical protein K9N46_10075 [Candidatus Marinimicrobia bacterium]|nr:hypothetical protein [Candidatus Neomarinimicrobiota bacterium]MCF7829276.1 hypothetical protein [Candidatus Neomarinimicrobiota bacterium]MCF7881071.1 hypothetical protein [Candidatus Neomarinimicrobiota bacterium]
MAKNEYINIGVKEQKVRLVLGILMGIVVVVMAVMMARNNLTGIWGGILFILTYQAVRFYFDYRTGTCPLKAELGQEKLEGWMTTIGDPISDQEKSKRIRTKSRKAFAWSFGAAVVVTAVVLFI